MSGGQEKHVADASKLLADSRARHYWDPKGEAMASYKKVLGTPWEAWDVYLIYDPGVEWTGDLPPPPGYWMHQLRSGTREGQPLEKGVYLDPEVFRQEIEHRLAGLAAAR